MRLPRPRKAGKGDGFDAAPNWAELALVLSPGRLDPDLGEELLFLDAVVSCDLPKALEGSDDASDASHAAADERLRRLWSGAQENRDRQVRLVIRIMDLAHCVSGYADLTGRTLLKRKRR